MNDEKPTVSRSSRKFEIRMISVRMSTLNGRIATLATTRLDSTEDYKLVKWHAKHVKSQH